MISTMFVIGYIAGVHPYVDPWVNYQEIINEITVLMAAYPLLMFTTWIGDEELRLGGGYFILAMICGNVLFNITILLIEVIRENVRKCKLWWLKRQNRLAAEKRKRDFILKVKQDKEKAEQEKVNQKKRAEHVY